MKWTECQASEQTERQCRRASGATSRQALKASWRDESTARIPSGLRPRLRRGLDHARDAICEHVQMTEFVGGPSKCKNTKDLQRQSRFNTMEHMFRNKGIIMLNS